MSALARLVLVFLAFAGLAACATTGPDGQRVYPKPQMPVTSGY